MTTHAESLTVADTSSIRNEVVAEQTTELDTVTPEVEQQADDLVKRLLAIDPSNVTAVDQATASIEILGADEQTAIATKSRMLNQPLNAMMQYSDDGGPVAKSLIDLKMQVEELDPAGYDFDSSTLLRWLGKIPGVGSPMKRYFTRYQSAGVVIQDIMKSLEKGSDQLKRDNKTLEHDQAGLRELTHRLTKIIQIGQRIDAALHSELELEITSDDPRHKFLSEEILFPLRQRIQDLQQTLLVSQQGVLTVEMIIRNNKELIRGVSRANNVTVNALRVAVTLAIALANQKIVFEKIEAINKTTENLLAENATRLKTQGAEINRQASASQLDMQVLRQSFLDIKDALNQVSTFRQEALPQMAQNILEMDRLSDEGEEAIRSIENAKASKAAIAANSDFAIEIVD